ncbi:50S ribosome-binding GTPase [Desulfacinum hydrothermale DSM 13146]|uniref:50S ribosome-binding GTPase n=1 Tax=Desulfacinum hydrothermale DSM 13146 TaxID=1121390 RepID=A0A1W1XDZ3_9BACT|nr:GTPase domain-containing protein [Desulfacinum hydrothermale]SMC22255.1 50S ribosome-binding GTPase [Desulfacinum hydrothermale DSM 13146]
MSQTKKSTTEITEGPFLTDPPWEEGIRELRVPGFTDRGRRELPALCRQAALRAAVLAHKAAHPWLWVLFMGGTGTGKSTLFDAVCGERVSETGVERPKTAGAVGYAHVRISSDLDLPFQDERVECHFGSESDSAPLIGQPGVFHVRLHEKDEWVSVIFVDTPDLDSVEEANRLLAEQFFLLADGVVFVTSPEKYADDVPARMLKEALRQGAEVHLVCNKAGPELRSQDVLEIFQGDGLGAEPQRAVLLPFLTGDPVDELPAEASFQAFRSRLLEGVEGSAGSRLRERSLTRLENRIRLEMQAVRDVLEEEAREARRWKETVEQYRREAQEDVIADQEKYFTAETRAYLQAEIRSLFSRYDPLAKPRRWISQTLTAPLRLLGILKEAPNAGRRESLERVKEKIHVEGIQAAVQRFSRRVLEESLHGKEESRLYSTLLERGAVLQPQEVVDFVDREQEKLMDWLQAVFSDLAKGLPKGKEWGIYSTSVVWGLLIVSLETVLGGGFTMVDAVLDAAIAPYVTQGAMELFAYREIQRIARELAHRYQAGLVAVIDEQYRRFVGCLDEVSPDPERVQWVERLAAQGMGRDGQRGKEGDASS